MTTGREMPDNLPDNPLPFPHVSNPWAEITKDVHVMHFESVEQAQWVMRKLVAMERREQGERN